MNKKIGNIFKGDKVVWMIFFFLCMVSLVEVFSASSGLTYKSQNYIGPIIYHAGTIFIGVVVAIITLNIPCRYFKLMTPFLLLFSAVTLIWVWLAGTKVGDAGRWISLFGLTFQPSEIAKGTVVLAVAQILAAMQREDGADKNTFKWIMRLTLPACLFIGLENLSTAAMLFVVVYFMMFIGLVPMRQLAKLTATLVVMFALVLSMIFLVGHDLNADENQLAQVEQVDTQPKSKNVVEKVFHRADTWKSRIMKFGKSQPSPQEYDLDKDAQVAHANIAIVSSDIIGKGPGKSTERDFLSQAFSDFIYAIIIEELGILGAFFVLCLYIFLLYRCARIASRCENNFPAFLAMGLGLLLVIQAISI
jgi:cell division protein FtsW